MLANTQTALLALLTEPNSAANAAALEQFKQNHPEISAQEIAEWQFLLRELKQDSLESPADEFFSQQEAGIFSRITEEQDFQAFGDLISQLGEDTTAFDLEIFQESFFEAQSTQILARIQKEEQEAESQLQQDIAALKSLPVTDPGELFFRRQLKAILSQLPESQKSSKKSWLPLTALAAAAMLVLIIGIAKMSTGPEPAPLPLFGENTRQPLVPLHPKAGVEFVDLDDLDTEELDRLADRLSRTVWQGAGEDWVEPSSDWEDLSPQEMQKLIKKLEQRLKT